jgi:glycosyltransferase involved in cell wall biosynthesis
MNICLLTSTFLPLVGGLEIVVHNLATALTNLGHNVYLVTPYPRKWKERQVVDNYSYKVIRFGFKGYNRLKLVSATVVLTLAYIVKRYNIDVINAHNVLTPGSWSNLFRRFNKTIPIVGTPHGDDVQITPEIDDGARLDPKIDTIVKRNLAEFSCITAISPSIREDLYDLVENKDKIFDVPNGVWVENFQKNIDTALVRQKFGIPADSTVIISIGRNHPRKGFEYGLEAIAKLRKSGHNISYLLVGRSMDPIIERAKALSVSDCIITPGQVDGDTIAELMQASDIYLSSAIVESFGVATLEAMSAGLPCVVTDVAGSRDLVSSEYGFVVKSKDPENIGNKLKYLIKNTSVRKEMGNKACIEATKYDWSNVANEYLTVYRGAIQNHNHSAIANRIHNK